MLSVSVCFGLDGDFVIRKLTHYIGQRCRSPPMSNATLFAPLSRATLQFMVLLCSIVCLISVCLHGNITPVSPVRDRCSMIFFKLIFLYLLTSHL